MGALSSARPGRVCEPGQDGKHTATTNAAFDADLKQRDPRWGVRDVDDIVSEAVPHGLELREVVDMPANNPSLVLVKSSPAGPT